MSRNNKIRVQNKKCWSPGKQSPKNQNPSSRGPKQNRGAGSIMTPKRQSPKAVLGADPEINSTVVENGAGPETNCLEGVGSAAGVDVTQGS